MKIDVPIPPCLAKHGVTSVSDNLAEGESLVIAPGVPLFWVYFKDELVERCEADGVLTRKGAGDEQGNE